MPRRTPTVFAALFALAALLFLPTVLGYGIIDDAYISLRYARQLVAGEGLVFNAGERVEGYSNLLWTVALAAPLALGLPGPASAVLGGQLLGVLAAWLAGRVYGVLGPGAAGPGPIYLTLACASPWLCYLASGLEVGLYATLLMAAMLCFVRFVGGCERGEPRRRLLVWTGVWLGLASLTRPETPLLAGFHLVYLVAWGRGSLRVRVGRAAWLALPYGALLGALLVFRYQYYGQLLPNTYYAKVGAPSGQLLAVGFRYAGSYLLLGGGLFALALLLATRALRRRAGVGYLLGWWGTYVLGVVLEGGDHMALYRFFAPAAPALALLLALAVEALLSRTSLVNEGDVGRLRASLTVLLGLIGSLALALSPGPGGQSPHVRATVEVALAEQWGVFGRWLSRNSEPEDTIALLPIGAIGYHSRRPVLDMVGLTDAHIAHLDRGTGDDAFLGHEKFDNDYLLARRPRFVLAHHFVANREPVSESTYRQTAHYPVHRDLLRRPAFHAAYVYRLVRDGPGRYFFFYERRRTP